MAACSKFLFIIFRILLHRNTDAWVPSRAPEKDQLFLRHVLYDVDINVIWQLPLDAVGSGQMTDIEALEELHLLLFLPYGFDQQHACQAFAVEFQK